MDLLCDLRKITVLGLLFIRAWKLLFISSSQVFMQFIYSVWWTLKKKSSNYPNWPHSCICTFRFFFLLIRDKLYPSFSFTIFCFFARLYVYVMAFLWLSFLCICHCILNVTAMTYHSKILSQTLTYTRFYLVWFGFLTRSISKISD